MGFQLSDAQIADFANHFDDQVDQLRKHIDGIQGSHTAMAATWSGQARGEFDKFIDSYVAQARSMTETLTQTADSLRTTGKQVSSQDENSQAAIHAVASSLDLP